MYRPNKFPLKQEDLGGTVADNVYKHSSMQTYELHVNLLYMMYLPIHS